MATQAELYAALRAADAAGDAAAATRIAQMIAGSQAATSDVPGNMPGTPTIPADRSFGEKAMDKITALTSGANRSFFAGLPGIPMDTMANVVDLGKAAVGSAYMAATGKPAHEALDPMDRTQIPGTSAWLMQRYQQSPIADGFNPTNPADEGGYLQAIGAAIPGATRPGQIVQSAIGGAAGKAAYDASGGNAAAGVIGSLSPALARQGLAAGAKYAIRGGEAGRQNVENRIATLSAAGVQSPTVGLATGNRLIGGIENVLQDTPGAIGVMGRSRENALSGLQMTTQQAADLASTQRGPLVAGQGIQSGIRSFADDFRQRQEGLYNRLEQEMGSGTPIRVTNTGNALRSLTSTIPGAEAITGGMINPKIARLRQNFDADTGLAVPSSSIDRVFKAGGDSTQELRTVTRHGVTQEPDRVVRNGEGLPTVIPGRQIPFSRDIQFLAEVPGEASNVTRAVRVPGRVSPGEGVPKAPNPMLPFGGVKAIRSEVGSQLSNELLSGVPNAQNKRLYAALSEDMQNGAVNTSPEAERAFNRANDYTRAGMGRMERLAPFASKDVPEDAYKSLVGTLTGGRSSAFDVVKKSLPEGVRGQVAGTVIENLGKAPNSKQGAAGDVWSPETFLTRWNELKPEGQAKLLSGFQNADEVRASIEAVAKTAEMMRGQSMWNNASGTGGNTAGRDFVRRVATPLTMVAGAAGGVAMDPWAIPAVAAGLGSTNLLARGLTNQNNVNALARRTEIDPAQQQNLLRTLYLTNATGAYPQQ